MARRIRVVMARLGLDSHWRGSVMVARALRDAGMEVVFLGNQMPETIVEAAIQEGADLVGLSSLSGNHMVLVPRVLELLAQRGMKEVPVMVGGSIATSDARALESGGVAGVFGPGSSLAKIVDFVNQVATPGNA